MEAIADCLTRASNSTFWDWSNGSRLFFWRWQHWWKSARDGELLFHLDPPPKWRGINLPAPSWHYELLLRKKEEKLVHRQYLEFGFADCYVPRFGVLKSEDDIRLVWDATRNGVNETHWAPLFWMPTFRTLMDLIIKWLPCSVLNYILGNIPADPTPEDWRVPHQSDMDVGEMFLNYLMHYSERHMFGARIISGEPPNEVEHIMRFQRPLFGGALVLIRRSRVTPEHCWNWCSAIIKTPPTHYIGSLRLQTGHLLWDMILPFHESYECKQTVR